jgi:hypothetical protein
VLRERVTPLRGFAARPDGFARALDVALRVAVVRLVPPVDDLARVEVDFLAPVERELADFARPPLVLRVPPRDEDPVAPELSELSSIADHLPDMTRCAASATASAISEPSFVALAIMFVAACEAVSAASSPASRIARRAFGLALIAAAAAARPAASISLLIAALASLSTVSLPEDPLRADLAMASSPSVSAKRHFKPVTVPG